MRKRRQTLLILGTLLVIAALLTYWILPPTPSRLQASAYPAIIPDDDSEFSAYVAENRNRIRNVLRAHYFQPDQDPFLGLYTIDEVTDMRAPFELTPASHCNEDDFSPGILMVHGLTDSPYLLRSVANALKFRFPCALIRGLLTPGHGTVPGDLLGVDVDDWRATFDYGVDSFSGEVDELLVLGYSNGSALALDYLNRHPGQQQISRLILVSPGLESTNENLPLTPVLRFVWPWLFERRDEDAVKYESFPTAAGAQFYYLTRDVLDLTEQAHTIPALVFASADDTTTRSDMAQDYYCQWLTHPESYLYWFTAEAEDTTLSCGQSRSVSVPAGNERYVSFSHVALMVPPGNGHYGESGNYPACLAYVGNAGRYDQCMTDDAATVFAETSFMGEDGLYEGKLVRRSTFNPRFDEMLDSMGCFIDPECTGPEN